VKEPRLNRGHQACDEHGGEAVLAAVSIDLLEPRMGEK